MEEGLRRELARVARDIEVILVIIFIIIIFIIIIINNEQEMNIENITIRVSRPIEIIVS